MYTGTEPATALTLRPSADFVETPYIISLTDRALDYIRAGFPVHFSGPAGIGKTTLALHVAAQLGRAVVLICGDHEFNSSDLVGGLSGYHKKFVKDNFIRSVLKTDESMTSHWVDSRLTTACQYGLTLIYDEFTRSRPEANNVLLSVLEERILPLPTARGTENYLKVHPNFTALFTSNPEEYAGVYKSQDALRDRMVTIEVGNFDEETEVAITQAKSRLSLEDSQQIVSLVRKVRETKSSKLTPTVRGCIIIGKILSLKGEGALRNNGTFRQTCLDILMPEVPREEREKVAQVMDEALLAYFLKGGRMAEKKDKEENDEIEIDFGVGKIGFGGVFKGLGSLIDLAAKMNEEGVEKKGEIRGLPKGAKGVYGFSIRTLAGKPVIESFGNIKETARGPVVEEVREPMVDVFDEKDHILVIAELPGVSEDKIKVEIAGDILTLTASDKDRKYSKEVLLPSQVKAEWIKTAYKNGILEIRLEKKQVCK